MDRRSIGLVTVALVSLALLGGVAQVTRKEFDKLREKVESLQQEVRLRDEKGTPPPTVQSGARVSGIPARGGIFGALMYFRVADRDPFWREILIELIVFGGIGVCFTMAYWLIKGYARWTSNESIEKWVDGDREDGDGERLHFNCPHCGHPINRNARDSAGQQMNCPGCAAKLIAPTEKGEDAKKA